MRRKSFKSSPSQMPHSRGESQVCGRWAVVIFAAVATLLMVVSCGPRPKSTAKGSRTFVTTVSNEKAAVMFESLRLACETPGGICPDAVGLMATRESVDPKNTEIRQCTSFLVSKDIVATNSHCLPPDLRRANAACGGRVQVVFGRTVSLGLQTFECDRILFASDINEDAEDKANFMKNPDYAFFRLKKEVGRRRPLKLSREGLPDRTELKVLGIDPSLDEKIDGTLRVRTCLTTQNTMKSPSYVHSFSPLAISGNCATIKGNSGAPAVDSNGQVRAINFGGSAKTDKISSQGFVVPSSYNATSELVNVACIKAPADLRILEPNPRCNAPSVTLNQIIERLKEKTVSKAPELFEIWKKNSPTQFAFDLERVGNDYQMPKIACLADRNLISTDEKRIDIDVPVWGFEYAIASDYRVVLSSKEVGKARVNVTLKMISGTVEKPQIQIWERVNSQDPKIEATYASELPVCQ